MTYTDNAESLRMRTFARRLWRAAGRHGLTVFRVGVRYDAADRLYHEVTGYTPGMDHIKLDVEHGAAVFAVLLERYPTINWHLDHQYHVATGMLRRAPATGEPGFIPEDDRQFGGAHPVHLVPLRDWTRAPLLRPQTQAERQEREDSR